MMQVTGVRLFFLPVETRMPLKFGPETLTCVSCARVRLRVRGDDGRVVDGWGETPLSVQWVWPSTLSYEARHAALKDFCGRLAQAWADVGGEGHPLDIGHAFLEQRLPELHAQFKAGQGAAAMPWLAALVCCSPFDIALYDAYGKLTGAPVYATLGPDHLRHDLTAFLSPAEGTAVTFAGKYPRDFITPRRSPLPAWHLVGGQDPLETADLKGTEPEDGYPVLLRDWIRQDGLRCLKVKLRGNDSTWDYERLAKVGRLTAETGVQWLSADFNCTVTDPAYVNDILDRLLAAEPRTYGMLLYVEQPFPYDLERNPIDAHSVSARKPLFLDESAHDWRLVRLGRGLGWTGVALKPCKTQTGALLSLCWAKAHGMTLMVQDLTNAMLAQIPHVLLAAHAGTIMGVETNSMQFYPDASLPEAAVHPGLYRRRNGHLDLSTLRGPGYGYRLEEIKRQLPEPAVSIGD